MIDEQALSRQDSRGGDGAADTDDGTSSAGDGAGYARPIEPLSVPVLQAALEVERHGREWLEQALATRQAERDELRREVERVREALRTSEVTTAELRERLTSATAEAAALASQVAALKAERGDLRRQLAEAASELNAVVLKRDALSRERDSLVREIQTLQEQSRHAPAASPAQGSQPTAAELGRSLEMIAESVGALRAWSDEVRAGEVVPMNAMLVLEDRLRLLLAPLATLPELRIELARLGAQLAAVASGGGLPARDGGASGATPLMREPAERIMAGPAEPPVELRGAPVEASRSATDQPCRACQEQHARSAPRSDIFSRRDATSPSLPSSAAEWKKGSLLS